MLQAITIRNYALIKDACLQPSHGLNALTGESGAGKSIFLGALSLLMGDRADHKLLDTQRTCSVEAVFGHIPHSLQDYLDQQGLASSGTSLCLRREVLPNSRSRAFVNDNLIDLSTLKAIAGQLMSIHGQYDTLELRDPAFILELVDAIADTKELGQQYQQAFAHWQQAQQQEAQLLHAQGTASDQEYNAFLLAELEEAHLEGQSLESLEERLHALTHSQSIAEHLNRLQEVLDTGSSSVCSQLSGAVQLLHKLTGYQSSYTPLLQRAEQLHIEAHDMAQELSLCLSQLEVSSDQALQETQQQLDRLHRLLQKHKAQDVEALCAIRQQLQNQSTQAESIQERLEEAQTACQAAYHSVEQYAQALRKKRLQQLPGLAQRIMELLVPLGMADAQVSIVHHHTEATESGIDKCVLHLSANKGTALRPVGSVASGGELARLMLCCRYLLARDSGPMLVFDEIDTGVSGKIAQQMAQMFKSMAQHHQVLVITHQPQVAALASRHYGVYKHQDVQQAHSSLHLLDMDARIEALASMIGGANPSAAARKTAQEMLHKA